MKQEQLKFKTPSRPLRLDKSERRPNISPSRNRGATKPDNSGPASHSVIVKDDSSMHLIN